MAEENPTADFDIVYGDLNGLKVGIWGLTYKPDTGTLRRSIALGIMASLSAQGIAVKAFDPLADLDEVSNLPRLSFSMIPMRLPRIATRLFWLQNGQKSSAQV